jgi:DNA-binding NtrC family response regulator
MAAKGSYVCESVSDREIQAKIPWIARSDVPVLITGDSGSGKERIAQDIALQSKRDGSLIRPSNCAEFTDTLLASDLFGHLKDSFTSANRHRLGKVLEASGYQSDGTAGAKKDFLAWLSAKPKYKAKESIAPNNEFCYKLPEGVLGGTLILDEIAELSPQAQATLLRLLDGLPIRPVGYEGMGFLPNVRIIAMTNDVRKLRDETRFRPDLLSRFNGWHIHVDSISRRLETVRGIVRETVQDMALRDNKGKLELLRLTTTDEAVEKICASLANLHGGVRGIIALVRRACIFAAISGSKQILDAHIEAALVEEFRLIDEDANSGAKETTDLRSVRENIVSRLELLIPNPDWDWHDFARACKDKQFLSQTEYDKWSGELAQTAGLDQGKTTERDLFTRAIKYNGKNMAVWLGQVRHQIVLRSNGKLQGVNRNRLKWKNNS